MSPVELQQAGADERARDGEEDVRRYWNSHPLGSLESQFTVGSPEFFAWHDQVRTREVEAFAMHLYGFDTARGQRVLDVGCGVGWLCWHFAKAGARIIGVDLAFSGAELTRRRLQMSGLGGLVSVGSAEDLPFKSETYDVVTCAGVLHHTPRTDRGVKEIHRVLKPGGRAVITLYVRNWLLSPTVWPFTRWLVHLIGRRVPCRTDLSAVREVEDLVRLYDGDDNPIGKAYSPDEVRSLLQPFVLERLEMHYFPWRFLPLGHLLPRWLCRTLDRTCGLMIYASVRKHA